MAIDAMAAKGSQQNRDEIGKRRTIELVRSEQGEDFSESQDCNRRYPQFDTRIDVGIRADVICVRSIVSQRCCRFAVSQLDQQTLRSVSRHHATHRPKVSFDSLPFPPLLFPS